MVYTTQAHYIEHLDWAVKIWEGLHDGNVSYTYIDIYIIHYIH